MRSLIGQPNVKSISASARQAIYFLAGLPSTPAPGRIGHPKLPVPAVEGLSANIVLAACFQDRFPLVRLLQHPYLLSGRVSFAFHCLSPF